jgi:hypothetical protein
MWYIQILFSRKHDGKSFVVNILIEEQRKYKIVKKKHTEVVEREARIKAVHYSKSNTAQNVRT